MRQLFLLASLSVLFMFPAHVLAYTNGSIKSSTEIYGGTTGINSAYGYSITGIGDLDNDGTPDIVVGRTGESSGTGRGGIYIHFMNSNGSIKSTSHITDGTANGPTLATGDAYGYSVRSIGDLNNDGIQDIVVGSWGNDMGGAAATNRGAIFIHFLNRDGSVLSTTKIGQGTTNGPTLIANDRYGTSVTNIGDLDNDGIQDIAVGAAQDDTGGADRGAFYIHYMNRNATIKSTVKITGATANGATLINTDYYGASVEGIGDLDNDGIPDIAVGAEGDDTGGSYRGAMYIHYMNRNGSIKSTVKITGATANGPTTAAGDGYGTGITNMGDIDGDIINDIAVSAAFNDTGGADRGAMYIHYMNRNGSIKSTVIIAHGTLNGPSISNTSYYGTDIAMIGDINGDGGEDIGVGAPYDPPTITGSIWIHFMNPVPGVVVYDLDLDALATTVSVTEGQVGDVLTVRLGSQPANTVTITPAITGGQATITPGTLTFTTSNWNEPQSITITATNDTNRESTTNHTLSFSATSADTLYNGISIATVSVNVLDNDAPAINNVPTSLSITEGSNDTFEMTLNSQPTNQVTVNLTTDNGQATLSASSLIFTTGNWNIAQEITVTAVDDDIDEATSTTNIEITTTSSDLEYNNLSVDDVVVSVTDNDTTGVDVSDDSFSLIEGESDTFTISLTSQPTHDVTIDLSLDTNHVTLSTSTLTFTSADWDTPQTVTISTTENEAKDILKTDTIAFSISSTDTAYDALSLDSIDVSVTDDETAAVVLSESGLTIEEGATDSFTVRLTSQPSATVTVSLERLTEEVTIDITNLTFTTSTWATPQTIVVTATKDTLIEQNQGDEILFMVASSDTTYNNLSVAGLPIAITDKTSSTSRSSGAGFYVRPIVVQAPIAIQPPQTTSTTQLFVKQLQLGSQDPDVYRLQKFLNNRGFVVALTGPGSPGNETQRYGTFTRKAVQAFQKTYQISPMSGTFGPKTMATANILLKK